MNATTITKAGGSAVNYTTKRTRLQNALIAEYDSLGAVYTAMPVSFTGSGTNSGNLLYFYHPDHLGSSSLITNADGIVTQHVEYVPFGEVFIEERNSTWNTPYLFNAKELDEETGLYFYGARYYDPRTSVWLSVDPLAEDFAGIGSYVYCFNSPVRFIDIDGLAPGDPFKKRNAAAVDFGNYYNPTSIKKNKEFASVIYKVKIKGKTYYTYATAVEGTEDGVKVKDFPKPPKGKKVEATIQTHGAYDEIYGEGNDYFSGKDAAASDEYFKADGYLVTPKGQLLLYDVETGFVKKDPISNNMPFDLDHPDKQDTTDKRNGHKKDTPMEDASKKDDFWKLPRHKKEDNIPSPIKPSKYRPTPIY